MLTRTRLLLLASLGVALAAPALGCGGGVARAQASSPEPTSRAPVAPNAQGPLKMVGEALGDVPLSASQRSRIEGLASEADARHAEVRSLRKELINDLAVEIEAGHIDRSILAPKIDALIVALQKAQPADRASFEQLHTILGADQRVAFVDALEAHIGEHKGAWRDKRPLEQLSKDLQLSEDQTKKIRTAIMDHFAGVRGRDADGPGEHRRDGHGAGAKVLAAFKQDRFVIDEIAPPKDVAKQVAHVTDRALGWAEAVLPVLTPAQRAIAAQKLRDRSDSLPDMGVLR